MLHHFLGTQKGCMVWIGYCSIWFAINLEIKSYFLSLLLLLLLTMTSHHPQLTMFISNWMQKWQDWFSFSLLKQRLTRMWSIQSQPLSSHRGNTTVGSIFSTMRSFKNGDSSLIFTFLQHFGASRTFGDAFSEIKWGDLKAGMRGSHCSSWTWQTPSKLCFIMLSGINHGSHFEHLAYNAAPLTAYLYTLWSSICVH